MKLELFDLEARKIWKNVQGGSAIKQTNFELDVYKRLLSFFQVGDYYYWIFNFKEHRLETVSSEVEDLLGYPASDFTLQFLMDKIHPEDRSFFLDFENRSMAFLSQLSLEALVNYKVRHDYRMRKSNGQYIRILHQAVVMEHDEHGGLVRTIGVHTDISHLKQDGKPMLSFIGLNNEPSYINVDVEKVFTKTDEFLSKREKQVLILLIEGKLSKEIGPLLHISKQTVDNHRKNMLNKHNLNSTVELVTRAIREGWV